MRACVVCGAPSPVGARFCSSCGAAMARDEEEAGRVRKVVTVVFSDLAADIVRGSRRHRQIIAHVGLPGGYRGGAGLLLAALGVDPDQLWEAVTAKRGGA